MDKQLEDLSQEDEIYILEMAIVELRRMYDHISNSYDQLRVKAVTLIVGEVALATLLYSTKKFSFTANYYECVVVIIGLLLIAGSFLVLFWTITALQWMMPTDVVESDKLLRLHRSKLAFLHYVHKEYVDAINYINPRVAKRATRFNWALYLLAASAIILAVITFGGSH